MVSGLTLRINYKNSTRMFPPTLTTEELTNGSIKQGMDKKYTAEFMEVGAHCSWCGTPRALLRWYILKCVHMQSLTEYKLDTPSRNDEQRHNVRSKSAGCSVSTEYLSPSVKPNRGLKLPFIQPLQLEPSEAISFMETLGVFMAVGTSFWLDAAFMKHDNVPVRSCF